jgi:hypothetical protein
MLLPLTVTVSFQRNSPMLAPPPVPGAPGPDPVLPQPGVPVPPESIIDVPLQFTQVVPAPPLETQQPGFIALVV